MGLIGAGVAIGSYLIGSIPFALIVARQVAGVDLRTVGSGNIGATNASRIVGKKWGLVVLGLDILKGVIPTAVLPFLIPAAPEERVHLAVLGGVCAIVGHMFPVWLGFRGGKGVATSTGAALILAPIPALVAFVTFVVTMFGVRIVSLGSILAAIAFTASQMIFLQPQPFSPTKWSLAAFSVAIPLLIIIQHRANIARLLSGTEPKWKSGTVKPASATPEAQA